MTSTCDGSHGIFHPLLKMRRNCKLVIVLFAATIVTFGCTHSSSANASSDQRQAPPKREIGKSGQPGTPSRPKIDVEVGLMPATSAEFNGKAFGAYSDFVRGFQNFQLKACLRKQGFTSEQTAYLDVSKNAGSPIDNLQFPDLQMLQSGLTGTNGDGVNSQTNAADTPTSTPQMNFGAVTQPGQSQAATKALSAAVVHCSAEKGASRLKAIMFGPLAQKIMNDYNQKISMMPSDATIEKATKSLQTCMAEKGYPLTTPQAFFASLDQAIMQHRSTTNSRRAKVQAYGHCVVPLAKAMDNYRLRARRKILDHDALDLRQLQNQIDVLVQQYSASRVPKSNQQNDSGK